MRRISQIGVPVFFRMMALLLLASSLVAARSIAYPPVLGIILQAEKAWQHRDQPLQTETAIALWERALQADPKRVDLYMALTKACGRAYRHSKDPKERQFWADEARSYGELAIAKNPDSPEAHAALAEALGQWAQGHKGIHSLRVVKDAVKHLETAIALNPKYAFAHMLLSRFYEESPGWLSVGDKTKALEHAKLAVEYGDAYAINHVSLAKMYLARGHKVEARTELQKALALTPPADAIPETRSDQDDARELLKGL